ncbi:hypothetical protein P3T37_001734 [Kitasatospora sp. MAA4]|nr:hypothetical protein [Kitasatospora sp. MAA4]
MIPEKRDQIANRKKRGSHGGRPPKFDKDDYKERPRYDNLTVRYEATVLVAAINEWL